MTRLDRLVEVLVPDFYTEEIRQLIKKRIQMYVDERDAMLIGEAEEIKHWDDTTYGDSEFREAAVIYGRNTLRLEQCQAAKRFDTEEVL